MKRIYIILAAVCLLIQSCVNDEGNYDYVAINEVDFENINDEYSVMTGSTVLDINPTILMSEGVNPDSDRFEYEWVCVGQNGKKYPIATTRVLSTTVSLPTGSYTLWLKVKDKVTDVQWNTHTYLTVGTIYTRGILLIGENEEGNAEAQMLSMVADTVLISDILKNSGLPTLQGPIKFIHTGTPAYASRDRSVKVWVMTESGSYWMDRESMKSSTDNDVSKIIFTSLIPMDNIHVVNVAPEVINISGAIGNDNYRAIATNSGHVFMTSISSNYDNYPDPVNRIGSNLSNEFFPAAPYLFFPLANFQGVLWYDTQNDRFMRVAYSGTFSYTLTDNPNEPFPWNQGDTGRKMIYGENTHNKNGGKSSGNSYAIMKDPQGEFFIYEFYAHANNKHAKLNAYQIKKEIATDFANATMFAFSSKRSVIFYVANNKLYAYDYDPGNEKGYQFDIFGGDEISMIKFDTQINPTENALYVATYNSTDKGQLERYLVNTDPNSVTLTLDPTSVWHDLIKVKNFSWRPVK